MWTDRNDFSHTYFNFVCSVCKTHRSAGKCRLAERLAVQNGGGFRWRSHQQRHFDTDAAHTAAFKIDQASFYFQSNNRHIQRTFIFLSCIRSVLKYPCIHGGLYLITARWTNGIKHVYSISWLLNEYWFKWRVNGSFVLLLISEIYGVE